jgi:hypothetical protein
MMVKGQGRPARADLAVGSWVASLGTFGDKRVPAGFALGPFSASRAPTLRTAEVVQQPEPSVSTAPESPPARSDATETRTARVSLLRWKRRDPW